MGLKRANFSFDCIINGFVFTNKKYPSFVGEVLFNLLERREELHFSILNASWLSFASCSFET